MHLKWTFYTFNENSSYQFQVILELFKAITTRGFGGCKFHLVHVSHQSDRRPATYTTTSSQQKRPSWHGQYTVNTGNVFQNFLKHQDVQITILAAWRKNRDKMNGQNELLHHMICTICFTQECGIAGLTERHFYG